MSDPPTDGPPAETPARVRDLQPEAQEQKVPRTRGKVSKKRSTSKRRKKQNPMIMGALGGVSLVAGIALIVFGIFFLADGFASSRWPTVDGTVVGTRVLAHTSRAGRTLSFGGRREYYAEVVYRYVVGDFEYTSRRFALGHTQEKHSSEDQARADLRKYPPGSRVTVYYDPDDPANAVLAPGVSIGTWAPLLLGCLFVGVGLPMIVGAQKAWKPASRPRFFRG